MAQAVAEQSNDPQIRGIRSIPRYSLSYHKSAPPKKPSKILYGFAFIVAGIAEVVDILMIILEAVGVITIPAAGVGLLILAAIMIAEFIVFDIPVLLLIGATSKALKENGKGIANDVENISKLNTKINRYRKGYARVLKTARKTRLRKPVTRVAMKLAKITKKSNYMKILGKVTARMSVRVGLEKIPFIDFIPFRFMGVWKFYKEAKQQYEDALQIQKEGMEMQQYASGIEREILQSMSYENTNRRMPTPANDT
ncbi:MAG: hypothetical protein ABH833_02640 [Parcubacteria group bacterium]